MKFMQGSITIDLDTLFSHYRHYGLKVNYHYGDFISGCKEFLKILQKFNIKATFFLVGEDVNSWTTATIEKIIKEGHEIACHGMNHFQHMRYLSLNDFEWQIKTFKKLLRYNFLLTPVGFRSPGYNMDSKFIPILVKNDYLYDSSLFPSFLNPILKILNFWTMRGKTKNEQTCLGSLKHVFAPLKIYRTDERFLYKIGQSDLTEFPTTMTPYLRIPFCATFHLTFDYHFFLKSYHSILKKQLPIIYNFHLFDFVDFAKEDIKNTIQFQAGCYKARSISIPLKKKVYLFTKIIETMNKNYQFLPLKELL